MSFQHKTYTTKIAEKEFHIEVGKFANQANGSVVVTVGQTSVLVTATLGGKRGEEIDFLPLFVDYEEKLYAAGKIKGSRFVKREGRPSEESILTGRMIDRSIRPFFPKDFTQEVQVIITVLSIDGENDPDFIAMVGASLALSISDIPWNGPLAGVLVGLDANGAQKVFPSFEERDSSQMDALYVIDADDRLVMMELGGKEISEEKVLESFDSALPTAKEIIGFQKSITEEIGKEKVAFSEKSYSQYEEILSQIDPHVETLLYGNKSDASQVKEELMAKLEEQFPDQASILSILVKMKVAEFFKKNILENERRPDGRRMEQVRTLVTEIDILPRTHGTGHFKRGETQTLTVVTLGGPGDAQIVDEMEEEFTKHFMHHYNFPPFSVGDVRPLRGPGRREIGHGALAEKALQAMIPSKQEFPYTIRLVSEVLGSNGSSSQASVCSSSLAMMAAGIPIKRHIAGIAIGVVEDDNNNYKLLTDIQGPEDFYGEMDFKVAGTTEGVTAIQMDIKYKGLSRQMFIESMEKARVARLHIIEQMNTAISEPKAELSEYAPKISVFTITPEKIGEVIGSGGKTINKIIDETGVKIDIEDDGTVFVTSGEADGVKQAEEWIKRLAYVPEVGEEFNGKVKKVMNFGVFMELVPGTEGLLHISELSPEQKEHDKIKLREGEQLSVVIKNIDHLGRINLKRS